MFQRVLKAIVKRFKAFYLCSPELTVHGNEADNQE